MRLPGAPSTPRSALGRANSPTSAAELEAMRAPAWHQHGVAALAIADIPDAWLRQALINEATRRWGPRKHGARHG
ncbi:MAG: hypothetical protein IT204_25940 [Fimbriimonadaceae bacterium]|nr:hypothetical protein [Fimbriimonadaceae bacterium]